MPLIVGGSALPTDKPIGAFLHHGGEIHKVVAKNGDVIWKMITKLPKGGFALLDNTHYWKVDINAGSDVPLKIVWNGQDIPFTSNAANEYRVTVGEVNYVRGTKVIDGPNAGDRRYEIVKILNGYSYYRNASGVEKIYWREYGSPIDKIGIQAPGQEFFITDPAEITKALKGTYEKNGYRYYKGDYADHTTKTKLYYIGRVKL